jgi:hypothetical protein
MGIKEGLTNVKQIENFKKDHADVKVKHHETKKNQPPSTAPSSQDKIFGKPVM